MDNPASRWSDLYFAVWAGAAIGISVTACGNRVPPPGGPVDDIPPTIVSIEPDSNRVKVDLNATIRIEFDEEIMPSRGREIIRLQPHHDSVEKIFRRNAIEVRATGGFFPECTYCIEVSGEIADLRGNRLGKPLDFCFSTGDSIHQGVVTGTLVFPDSLTGTALFQATHLPDSLVYRVATGGDRSFRLSHLPWGRYHFLAYVDVDGDGRYEPHTDPWVEELGELGSEIVEIELEWKRPNLEGGDSVD